MSKWKTIDSAPKDRTPIVICADGIVGEAYFNEDDSSHDGNFYWAQTHWTDSHVSPIYPTHWQNLPPPPKEAK